MNFYAHNLLHESQQREHEERASQFRLIAESKRGVLPAHRVLIRNVGKQLVRIGTQLQD